MSTALLLRIASVISLLFTAGPNDEAHGVFGELTPH